MSRALHPIPLLSAVVLTACVTTATTAMAQDPARSTGIFWKCAQERDEYFHIRCLPLEIPSVGIDARAVTRPAATAGNSETNAGAAAPALWRGRDLRPVAVRGHDEVFSAEAWRLPLFARPTDPSAVTRLLESVLCGEVAHCRVSYGAGGAWSAAWR